MPDSTAPAPLDWSSAYVAVGLDAPPVTPDELEQDAAYASPSRPAVVVDPDDVVAANFIDVNVWELTGREKDIYEAGFFAGHLSRQSEVTAAENAFKHADDDANRYYRAAFDHDYHDCAVHQNRGKYQGAATRYADDDQRW
jgi:hypothetical protein